jgi:cytochrome c553
MPRHIVGLVLIMIGFIALAYGGKKFFTVDSFFQYGHYRGDSVAEIASDKPKFKGTAYCAPCHVEQLVAWSSGVHNSTDVGKVVKCEVCHGPGGGRDVGDVFRASATGPDHPKNMKMAVPADSRKLCTLCHERMTGRPLQQRQIVVADHAGTQQCTVCHNPHSPRLNLVSTVALRPGDAALGKVKAEACAGCHSAEGANASLPGPTLAGQNEAYLVEAITAYRTGARDNATMTAMVQGASVDDVDNIASYYAGLKCESTLNPERQAASVNRSTSAKCVACHGSNGVSTNRSWPNLVGQSREYLVNTLKAYKDGTRKNSLMTAVAKNLSDADVESAAAYFADAGCK